MTIKFFLFLFSLERIISEEKAIFEDVVEDFSSIDSIKSRFEEWKNKHEDCYMNAYISLCLPKLFAPFIRLQLLDWNPFEVQLIPFLWTLWTKGSGTELGKIRVCADIQHHATVSVVSLKRFTLHPHMIYSCSFEIKPQILFFLSLTRGKIHKFGHSDRGLIKQYLLFIGFSFEPVNEILKVGHTNEQLFPLNVLGHIILKCTKS